jgi:hypothetical protein
MRWSVYLLLGVCAWAARPGEYQRRVDQVRNTTGFVALWDFVTREAGGVRFDAHQGRGGAHDLRLDAVNYVRDYWGRGRAASYDDFPLLGRGPFGEAVRFVAEKDADFRPCLLVPRARMNGSRLDVKGPGRSASMVVWLIRESGNHAIAGIWHEGTDLKIADAAARVERGQRQYALFAGLAANNGASAVHVSENGGASFGDRYARNLAVTPELIPAVPADADAAVLDRSWSVVAFSFDNAKNTVTAYLDGRATEYWIDEPANHLFFRWPYKGWVDGSYRPPEKPLLSRTVVEESDEKRVELLHFPFTKVRVTLQKDSRGRFTRVAARELVALKANPYWFEHDLYSPESGQGGPFTIGRVIHSSRNVGFTGYIGGVAVFDRALGRRDMERLAGLARGGVIAGAAYRSAAGMRK